MLDELFAVFTQIFLNVTTGWLDAPPDRIESTAVWFTGHEWQVNERAVDDDLKHGRFQDFGEIDDVIYDLMTQATVSCQICEDDPNPTRNLAEALKRASQPGRPA